MSALTYRAGNLLMQVPGTTPKVRCDCRAVSWSFGELNNALMVMSDLMNPLTITVTCIDAHPDEKNTSWKRGLTGYSRTFTFEEYEQTVGPWWASLAPKDAVGEVGA
jgi:hypothetical protein